MGDYIDTQAMDAKLANVADNGDLMVVCSQEPASYTEAFTTYKLAHGAITVGDGNGDVAIADDGAGGRKLTWAEKLLSGDADGDGTHVAVLDTTNSRIKARRALPASVTVTTTAGVLVEEWDYDDKQPA